MVLDILAWAVCGCLLLLTIACQRPRWQRLRDLKYRDVVAIIPAWTFFAPNPGTTDTRVLWRERLVGGSISPWHEVLPPTGGVMRALWNPTKRERKLITDVGPMIMRLALKNPHSEFTLVSLPYLILLHWVSNLPASSLTVARQFLIVQTVRDGTGEDEMRPLFASRWHSLASPTGVQDVGETPAAVAGEPDPLSESVASPAPAPTTAVTR